MKKKAKGILALTAVFLSSGAEAQALKDEQKPTIVLVHGAFADSSSWNGVTAILQRDGFNVVAVANPLRGVKSDADAVADVVRQIAKPVILVGHSYGGSIVNEAAYERQNVKGLVFVSAFAPDVGETAGALSGKFPGGSLAKALAPPVALSRGGSDLYIDPGKFPAQFAADVPASEASLMAVNQRPIAERALSDPATHAAWKSIPSWSIYGDADRNIPPQALAFMARRAKSRETVVIRGGSHVVMVSHPLEVATIIEHAAKTR